MRPAPGRGLRGSLLLLAALLVLAACGDETSTSPVEGTTLPIPQGEDFYLSATMTILTPNQNPTQCEQATQRPPLCDGTRLDPGTVLTMDADLVAAGIVSPAELDESAIDVQFVVSGTDRANNFSLTLQMPRFGDLNSEVLGTPGNEAIPVVRSGNTWSAFTNLDPFCQEEEGVLFVTEQSCDDCSIDTCPSGGDGTPDCQQTCGLRPCCLFSNDELRLTELTLITDAAGNIVIDPGSPIAGCANFIAATRFRDPQTGGFANAQMEVDACFRIPAVRPPSDISPFVTMAPAPCTSCP